MRARERARTASRPSAGPRRSGRTEQDEYAPVDLDGNQMNGEYLNDDAGFPGFDLTAPQSLAYVADMQESGVLDGSPPEQGPNSAGADSGRVTVPDSGTTGTWVDETDIRPTLMYLTGLKDDYEHDGRVVTPILAHPNAALSAPGVEQLAACYKQLNSSVGQFGTDTLIASTAGMESTSPNDATYAQTEQALTLLDSLRDALAGRMKLSLDAAAFANHPVSGTSGETALCNGLLEVANRLAQGS